MITSELSFLSTSKQMHTEDFDFFGSLILRLQRKLVFFACYSDKYSFGELFPTSPKYTQTHTRRHLFIWAEKTHWVFRWCVISYVPEPAPREPTDRFASHPKCPTVYFFAMPRIGFYYRSATPCPALDCISFKSQDRAPAASPVPPVRIPPLRSGPSLPQRPPPPPQEAPPPGRDFIMYKIFPASAFRTFVE